MQAMMECWWVGCKVQRRCNRSRSKGGQTTMNQTSNTSQSQNKGTRRTRLARGGSCSALLGLCTSVSCLDMAHFFLDSALSRLVSPADDGTGPTKRPLVCLASQYRYPLQHCSGVSRGVAGWRWAAACIVACWRRYWYDLVPRWYALVRYMCGPGSHPGAPHRNSEFRRKVVRYTRCWVMLGLFACRVQTARRGDRS
jgi:hypothetical protein